MNQLHMFFLIDDSGSMSGNDPNCERATAIKKIMENKDVNFPYSVYRFTDESQLLKEMGPYSQDDSYQFDSNGSTNIIGSINTVLDEIIANKSMDDSPRIMLVSDGSSSSLGANSVIDRCNDNGISISSISFGNFFGNSLLNKLATRTGGVYVEVENIDNLYNEMQTAITSNASRNLVSERFMLSLNWLY
ncbi:MAG: VWA domain-containing protein, partial [Eubacterium sp.]|nr:VWA domain-containing protein [Eubacterium sp.]